jgi:hypothetical protein
MVSSVVVWGQLEDGANDVGGAPQELIPDHTGTVYCSRLIEGLLNEPGIKGFSRRHLDPRMLESNFVQNRHEANLNVVLLPALPDKAIAVYELINVSCAQGNPTT